MNIKAKFLIKKYLIVVSKSILIIIPIVSIATLLFPSPARNTIINLIKDKYTINTNKTQLPTIKDSVEVVNNDCGKINFYNNHTYEVGDLKIVIDWDEVKFEKIDEDISLTSKPGETPLSENTIAQRKYYVDNNIKPFTCNLKFIKKDSDKAKIYLSFKNQTFMSDIYIREKINWQTFQNFNNEVKFDLMRNLVFNSYNIRNYSDNHGKKVEYDNSLYSTNSQQIISNIGTDLASFSIFRKYDNDFTGIQGEENTLVVITKNSVYDLTQPLKNLKAGISNNSSDNNTFLNIGSSDSESQFGLWCEENNLCEKPDKNLLYNWNLKLQDNNSSIPILEKLIETKDKYTKKVRLIPKIEKYIQGDQLTSTKKDQNSEKVTKSTYHYYLTESKNLYESINKFENGKNNVSYNKIYSDVEDIVLPSAQGNTGGVIIVIFRDKNILYAGYVADDKYPNRSIDLLNEKEEKPLDICFYSIYTVKNIKTDKIAVYQINDFGKTNTIQNLGEFDRSENCYLYNKNTDIVYKIEKGIGGDRKSQLQEVPKELIPLKPPCEDYIFGEYRYIRGYFEGYYCQKDEILSFTPQTSIDSYKRLDYNPEFKDIKLLSNKKMTEIKTTVAGNDNNNPEDLKITFEDGSTQEYLSDSEVENLSK
jgi:hypothetical protein